MQDEAEAEIRADEREEVLEEVAQRRTEESQWDRIKSLETSLRRLEQRLDTLTSSPEADLATVDKAEEAATAETATVVEAAREEAAHEPAKPRRRFRIL